MHQPFESEGRPLHGGDAYWGYYFKGYAMGDPEAQEQRMMFTPDEYYSSDDEPLFYTSTRHEMNFKCQCSRCARLCTITMEDAKFLRTLGIMWKVPHVSANGGGQTDSREQDARETGRTQEAPNLR